jgi:FkbH-like protein
MTRSASLIARGVAALGRDKPIDVARKVVANGAALLSGPLRLRQCDVVGARARTRGAPIVENLGRIEIGDDFQVNCAFDPVKLYAAHGAVLDIGDRVNINFGTRVSAHERVRIGSGVSIGPQVVIGDESGSGIDIGDDVWLAARVRVTKGVRIGRGTVVTAGSIVSASLPEDVIAGGAPARVLRAKTDKQEQKVTRARQADVRGTVIADFTADECARALRRDDALGPIVDVDVAPFDQVVQTLHKLRAPTVDRDFVFVWTRPERVSAAFARVVQGETVTPDVIDADVDAFAEMVKSTTGARFVFVASWTMPSHVRGLGMLDMRQGGVARTLAAMNMRLAERLEGTTNVFLLDASRWMGAGTYSSRLWYLGKVGLSREVFDAAARDVRAALRGLRGQARKLLIVDLDDTLWGGIVGDIGWQDLRLGGHDPVGEALVDFQRALLALTKRGVALGVVSKNTEAIALEAMRSHPEMVLKEKHLAGWRINWRDKAQNVAELVQELNVGLQSVVFIDDNPVERARVRDALPEVFVPDWPEDKTRYVEALHALACFDAPHVSHEDAARATLFAQERARDEMRSRYESLDDWIAGLGTVVRIEALSSVNLPRTVQLMNKTNQMNLRTRRLSETELEKWAADPNHELWVAHVSDKLGDAGLTGIVGLDLADTNATVADFVLSCRVMGRRIEETLVWFAARRARERGAQSLVAPYVATPKNAPCQDFFASLGALVRDGDAFIWDGTRPIDPPRGIDVRVEVAR